MARIGNGGFDEKRRVWYCGVCQKDVSGSLVYYGSIQVGEKCCEKKVLRAIKALRPK